MAFHETDGAASGTHEAAKLAPSFNITDGRRYERLLVIFSTRAKHGFTGLLMLEMTRRC